MKFDLLSSTELEKDRVGVNDHRRKEKSVKTITEFSSSPNPLLAQEVFMGTKRNLLEGGETYSDEFILDNVNKVLKPKINSEKTEDEMLAMTIKRIGRNRKQLINTGATDHNNAVRNEGISRIDLSGL